MLKALILIFMLFSSPVWSVPHDRFSSPDIAAIDATRLLRSMENVNIFTTEYATVIYSKDGYYSYTTFVTGTDRKVYIPYRAMPSGSVYVGTLHNHPIAPGHILLQDSPSKEDLAGTTVYSCGGNLLSSGDYGTGNYSYLLIARNGRLLKFRLKPGRSIRDLKDGYCGNYYTDYEASAIPY